MVAVRGQEDSVKSRIRGTDLENSKPELLALAKLTPGQQSEVYFKHMQAALTPLQV